MFRRYPLPAALAAIALTIPAAAQPPKPPPALPGVGRPADPALAPVPTDAFLFVSVKVSKLWDNPAAKSLRDWFAAQKEGPFDAVVGVRAEEVDRVTLFRASWDHDDGGAPVVLVTTRKPYNEAAVLKALGLGRPGDRPLRTRGRAFPVRGEVFRWVVPVDERTLLYLSKDADDKSLGPALLAQLIARKPDGPLAGALLAAQAHDLTAAVDLRGLDRLVDELGIVRDEKVVPFLGLLRARTATLTADLDRTARVQLAFAFADAQAARRAAPALEEGIKFVATLLPKEPDFNHGEGKLVGDWLLKLLAGAKVTAIGPDVVATADVPYADDLAKLVTALPKDFGRFRVETEAMNNLKQLGLAMHNFESAHGRLPGDAGVHPMAKAVSWRVEILPYVEQANLYNRLDPNLPFDHPKNVKLLEGMEMPRIFEHPGRPAPKGHTYFRIFSMPKDSKEAVRPFFQEGERGPRFAQVTDGLANTILIVEAGEAVPWYKPDVLAYDGKLPLPPLGAKDADKFLAVMGDGSVRVFRPSKLGEKTLRALVTINGGEIVDIPK
jgi:hypothetical protein